VPIFTYRCTGCGREQDLFQTIEEGQAPARPGCPFCTEYMARVPSRVNVLFKGPGWTPTHYPDRKENK